jgi:asparagine synthase (glutamine-hydrolysing)
VINTFDFKSVDIKSIGDNIFHLSEMGGGFCSIYISQIIPNLEICIVKDIFFKIPFYFSFSESGILQFSDNLKNFNCSINTISDIDIVSYIHTSNFHSKSATVFKEVFTIPSGAHCFISLGKIRFVFEEAPLENKNKTVLDALKLSMENQVSSFKAIASHVSGGLDSSGLSSILKTYFTDKKIHYCAVDAGECTLPEIPYQMDFEEKFTEKVHLYPAEINEFAFLEEYSNKFAEPLQTYGLPFLNINLVNNIKKKGYDALVVGNAGDNILGHGFEYINTLLKKGDFINLRKAFSTISEADVLDVLYPKWSNFSPPKKYNLTASFFLFRHRASSKIGFIRTLYSLIKLSTFHLSIFNILFLKLVSTKKFFIRKYSKKENNYINVKPVFKSSLVKETKGQQTEKHSNYCSEISMQANYFFYNLSKLTGVSILTPFQDLGVLSYCQHVPLKDKFGEGFGRAFYRKELQGILPEKIRNRIHKTSFSTWQLNSIKSLLKESQSRGISPLLYKFVEPAFVNDTFTAFENAKEGSQKQKQLSILVYRILNVNIWLSSF